MFSQSEYLLKNTLTVSCIKIQGVRVSCMKIENVRASSADAHVRMRYCTMRLVANNMLSTKALLGYYYKGAVKSKVFGGRMYTIPNLLF